MGKISGAEVDAWWFDPRTGTATPDANSPCPNSGTCAFDPPGSPAWGNDWVLVLDDPAMNFPPPGVIPLHLTTPDLGTCEAGIHFSAELAAIHGTPPYAWSLVSGALPDGVALNSSGGEVSGTPAAPGSFTPTIRVTDSAGAVSERAIPLVVEDYTPVDPAITTAVLPNGAVGSPYASALEATAGNGPLVWSLPPARCPTASPCITQAGSAVGRRPPAPSTSPWPSMTPTAPRSPRRSRLSSVKLPTASGLARAQTDLDRRRIG